MTNNTQTDERAALDEKLYLMEDTLGALKGKHANGWINITMQERRLFASLLSAEIERLDTRTTTGGEGLREAVKQAYVQGAHDVHANYQEDRDPSFSEAASDYAASFNIEPARQTLDREALANIINPGAFRSGDVGGLRSNQRMQAFTLADRILAALSPAPQADIDLYDAVRDLGGQAVVTITDDGWKVRAIEAEAIPAAQEARLSNGESA